MSALPSLTGPFFDLLLAVNPAALSDFQRWLFHPGMLFEAPRQWWGQEKPRPSPHEGLDLCWFEDQAGRRRALDQGLCVPVPFPGRIVHLCRDFLGHSIFIAHALRPDLGRCLYTAFGHTAPRPGLAVAQTVRAGEVIATLSAPAGRPTAVPPHLHLTLALLPDPFPVGRLAWETLGSDPDITLLDPLAVFPTCFAMV